MESVPLAPPVEMLAHAYSLSTYTSNLSSSQKIPREERDACGRVFEEGGEVDISR